MALGADLAPEQIDGFPGRGHNLYDANDIPSLRENLLTLKKSKVAISIMGIPYKCPPAPYGASMLISDLLLKNGTGSSVEINVYAPFPISLPVAGLQASHQIVDTIRENAILFRPSCRPKSVREKELVFENG